MFSRFPQRDGAGIALALLLSLGLGCRDEQAGPRPKSAARQAPLRGRISDSPPADLSFRGGGSWAGGTILYLGSRVTPAQPKPGQSVVLAHYFQARAAPPSGFGFFVHVVERQTGQMILNADHELQPPLSSWPVGKVIEDVHTIVLPPGSPEQMTVVLGFWNDNGRLPVDPPGPTLGENRMVGPPLEIAGEKLPEYHLHKTAKPPLIDGLLNDKVWAQAEPVELRGSFDGRATAVKTVARLLYDDTNLYVSFDCEDPDVWGTMMKRDDPIYNEEVVEIFIDADGDGRTYNEIEVSPNNTLFDAYFPARRQGMDTSWDSGAKTAVQVRGTLNNPSDRDEGWTVEMAIPIARLAAVPHVPPRKGDRWRFNLYRLEHVERRYVEGQAFSPLFMGDFHHLPRFGWLIFE